MKSVKEILANLKANVFGITTINTPNHSNAPTNQFGIGFGVCKAGNFKGTEATSGGYPLSRLAIGMGETCSDQTTLPNNPFPNLEKFAIDARADGSIAAAAKCINGSIVEWTEAGQNRPVFGPHDARALTPDIARKLNQQCGAGV